MTLTFNLMTLYTWSVFVSLLLRSGMMSGKYPLFMRYCANEHWYGDLEWPWPLDLMTFSSSRLSNELLCSLADKSLHCLRSKCTNKKLLQTANGQTDQWTNGKTDGQTTRWVEAWKGGLIGQEKGEGQVRRFYRPKHLSCDGSKAKSRGSPIHRPFLKISLILYPHNKY